MKSRSLMVLLWILLLISVGLIVGIAYSVMLVLLPVGFFFVVVELIKRNK